MDGSHSKADSVSKRWRPGPITLTWATNTDRALSGDVKKTYKIRQLTFKTDLYRHQNVKSRI